MPAGVVAPTRAAAGVSPAHQMAHLGGENELVSDELATTQREPPQSGEQTTATTTTTKKTTAKPNADAMEAHVGRANQHGVSKLCYYVPINVTWKQQQQPKQTDSEDGKVSEVVAAPGVNNNSGVPSAPPVNQVSIHSIAWTFVRADGNGEEKEEEEDKGNDVRRDERVAGTGKTLAMDINQNDINESLASAIKKLDELIGSEKCLLVTCGPLPLRQYLHPAALRAGIKLAPHYSQYADLSKEFTRRYGHVSDQQQHQQYQHPQQQQQQQQEECCDASNTMETSQATNHDPVGQCYCCDFYAAESARYAAYCNAQQQEQQQQHEQHQQQQVDFYSMTPAPQFAVQQQQQQQTLIATCSVTDTTSQRSSFQQYELQQQQQQPQQQQQQQQQTSGRIGLRVEQMLKCCEDEGNAHGDNEDDADDDNEDAGQDNGDAAADDDGVGERQPEEGAAESQTNGFPAPGYSDVNSEAFYGDQQQKQQRQQLDGCRLVESMGLLIRRMLNDGHQFNRIERIKRRVEVGLCDHEAQDGEQRVIKARGLPWQASEQDIADFFVGLNIAKGGVALCLSRQGRRNGEALILFENREHRNLALGRHKQFMGARYIEVYRGSAEDFLSVATGYNNKAQAFLSKGAQVIVRMRGLPFTCTAKQIVDFFASTNNNSTRDNYYANMKEQKSCEVFAKEEGILFVKNHDNKPIGDAFVLFANEDQAQRALAKHHQNIGSRYVELFRSTVSEVQQVLNISMEMNGAANAGQPANAAPTAATAAGQQQAKQTASQRNTSNSKSPAGSPLAGQGAKRSAGNAGATYAQVATGKKGGCSGSNKSAAVTPKPQPEAEASDKEPQVQAAGCKPKRRDQSPAAEPSADACDSSCSAASSPSSMIPNSARGSPPMAKSAPPSESSAFDNNSVNSSTSCESSDGCQPSGDGPAASSNGDAAAAGSRSLVPPEVSTEQAGLGHSSGPSSAQSPISTMSAASSNSSSYKSSQFESSSGAGSGSAGGQPHQRSGHQARAGHTHALAGAGHYHHQRADGYYATAHENAAYHNQRYYHQQHQHSVPPVMYHHHHHQDPGYQGQPHRATYYSNHQHYPSNGQLPSMGMHLSPAAMAAAAAAAYHQHHLAMMAGQAPYLPPPPPPPSVGPHQHNQVKSQHHHHHQHMAAAAYHPFLFYPPPPPPPPPQASMPVAGQAAPAGGDTPDPSAATPSCPADGQNPNRRDCIRMRGLPFEAQVEDVLQFLGERSKCILLQGIHMVYGPMGQPTGEAVIQMDSCASAASVAQEFHKKVMSVGKKQRYIEVISSSIEEISQLLGMVGLMGRTLMGPAAHQQPAAGYPQYYMPYPGAYQPMGAPAAGAAAATAAATTTSATTCNGHQSPACPSVHLVAPETPAQPPAPALPVGAAAGSYNTERVQ